jgi:hypothetical protein
MQNVRQKPQSHDLSSSMDDYHAKVQESMTISDPKTALVGIHFIKEELITKLPKNYQHVHTKQTRLQKWREMI